ncbi:MAG: hypothetical protein AB7J13_06765 [Pyrinomonadaceae bacterium]
MVRGDLVPASASPQPRRSRFSVDQYYTMIEMGMIDNCAVDRVISENDHVPYRR